MDLFNYFEEKMTLRRSPSITKTDVGLGITILSSESLQCLTWISNYNKRAFDHEPVIPDLDEMEVVHDSYVLNMFSLFSQGSE